MERVLVGVDVPLPMVEEPELLFPKPEIPEVEDPVETGPPPVLDEPIGLVLREIDAPDTLLTAPVDGPVTTPVEVVLTTARQAESDHSLVSTWHVVLSGL